MKKIRFIINPKSGVRFLGEEQIENLVRSHLNKILFTPEFCYTEARGHATELALEAAALGLEYVVAVGGDGTVNETAAGVINTNTALGIVPLGSGNGLARQLELSLDPATAIGFLNNAPIIYIDYGMINQTPFFCTAGVGFDAHVAAIFDHSTTRGFAQYAKLAMRELFKYKPKHYRILSDTGQEIFEGPALLIAFANCAQYGNNTYIAPLARPRDGLLDLVIVRPFAWHKYLSVGYALYRRRLHTCAYVDSYQLKSFQLIISDSETMAHLDGEPKPLPQSCQITAVPRALKMMTGIFL